MTALWATRRKRAQELGLLDEHGEAVDQLVLRGVPHIDELVAHIAGEAEVEGDGSAHWMRDEVLLAALRTIVLLPGAASEIAAAALKVEDLEFSRWYD